MNKAERLSFAGSRFLSMPKQCFRHAADERPANKGWRRDCGAIGRIIRIDYLAAFFALRYLRIIRNSHSAHSSTMAAMMAYITISQVGIPALESVA